MNASLNYNLSDMRVSRETEQRLDLFAATFRKWAKSINLVAPSTVGDMARRHVADSMQIFKLNSGPLKWVDMGSGGGFPGIITGILLMESGAGWVHLVESNQKKAAFLRNAIRETGARASVHSVRVEDSLEIIGDCDAISARALADLDKLLEFSEPWFLRQVNLRGYFHKGRDYAQEIDKARSRWNFDLVKHKSEIENDSYILEVTNLLRM